MIDKTKPSLTDWPTRIYGALLLGSVIAVAAFAVIRFSEISALMNAARKVLTIGFNKSSFSFIGTVLSGDIEKLNKNLNEAMILKMDYSLFSNSSFMDVISKEMPDLAGNQEFLNAIKNNTLDKFLTTLDSKTQNQLFELYNNFAKNLPIEQQTDQMKKFMRSFEALKDFQSKSIDKVDMIGTGASAIVGLLLLIAIVSLLATIAQQCCCCFNCSKDPKLALTPVGVVMNLCGCGSSCSTSSQKGGNE